MQLRAGHAGRAGRLVRLAVAVLVLAPVGAVAEEAPPADDPDVQDLPAPQDAESPSPARPPLEPIDTSKHGTVEAEIPWERESDTGPPSRSTLKDRLTEPRWDRGGYFLGLGGHYAIEFTDQIGGKDTFASGGGLSMRVGLKHDRFWQTEFAGVYTSKFKDGGVDFFAWGVHFGERFYLTKTRLQPYVGAHVGFIQLRGTNYRGGEFAFVPKFNAGIDLYQRQTFNWELDLSYYLGEIGAGKDSSFATATLGFTWF